MNSKLKMIGANSLIGDYWLVKTKIVQGSLSLCPYSKIDFRYKGFARRRKDGRDGGTHVWVFIQDRRPWPWIHFASLGKNCPVKTRFHFCGVLAGLVQSGRKVIKVNFFQVRDCEIVAHELEQRENDKFQHSWHHKAFWQLVEEHKHRMLA